MKIHRPFRPSLRALVPLAFPLFLAGSRQLHAQSEPVLEVGSRVRVSVPRAGVRRVEGFVREIDASGDSLVIRPDGTGQGLLRLANSDIAELDVAVEGRSRAGSGLVLGLLGGAAVGFGIGLAEGDDPPNTGFFKGPSFSATQKGAIYGVVLGVAGAAAGYLIGGSITDRWQPIETSTFSAKLSPAVAGDGMGLGVVLSWSPALVRAPRPR